LAKLLHDRDSDLSVVLNKHYEEDGAIVFREACLGCEGIVSKRLGSSYRSGRSPLWLKGKNPNAPAGNRQAEEECGAKADGRTQSAQITCANSFPRDRADAATGWLWLVVHEGLH